MQLLDTLPPASPTYKKCLRVLRWTCGTRGILPMSYTLPDIRLITSSHPVAFGAGADVYEGNTDGGKVCVKRVRVYSDGDMRGVQKVRCPFLFLSDYHSKKRIQSSTRRLSCGSTGSTQT